MSSDEYLFFLRLSDSLSYYGSLSYHGTVVPTETTAHSADTSLPRYFTIPSQEPVSIWCAVLHRLEISRDAGRNPQRTPRIRIFPHKKPQQAFRVGWLPAALCPLQKMETGGTKNQQQKTAHSAQQVSWQNTYMAIP